MKIEKTIKLNGENENVYKEYEPGTIQSVFGSINSYLRDINYGCDLRVDPKFYHTWKILEAKMKDLKEMGKAIYAKSVKLCKTKWAGNDVAERHLWKRWIC